MLYKIRLKPFREQKFTLSFHTFTEKVCMCASTAFLKNKLDEINLRNPNYFGFGLPPFGDVDI